MIESLSIVQDRSHPGIGGREIDGEFDIIVEFAGVEESWDSPVKGVFGIPLHVSHVTEISLDLRSDARSEGVRITETISLAIPEVSVIRYGRYRDQRGYFTETSRRSDLTGLQDVQSLSNVEFVQTNESFSQPGTVRGLHLQWNPYMGKLVRTIQGRMIDMVLDVRKGSPTFGMIVLYDMPSDPAADFGEWIWVPPGFAHGNFFMETTLIEYFCSGEYSPGCEGCISPVAPDIDWSLCDRNLKHLFNEVVAKPHYMSDKDRDGFSLADWVPDPRSDNFVYGRT